MLAMPQQQSGPRSGAAKLGLDVGRWLASAIFGGNDGGAYMGMNYRLTACHHGVAQ
jgi:hypothetical protein